MNRAGAAPLPEDLPLVHVTAAWPAKEIVAAGKLVTRRCPVFESELLYFFALRPAYRSRFGAEESHQISRFPVVFVLRADAVKQPLHAYPFDTGGAALGAFAKQADKYVPLEDYALEPSHRGVSQFISWAFGTLDAYFDGRLRATLQDEVRPHESVAVSYLDIARMGVEGSNEHDKRASTVEIASSHNVDLAGNVQLIVLPKQYLEGNQTLLDSLKPLGADLETYDWQPNRTPDEFQKDIMRICRDWYRRQGIMP